MTQEEMIELAKQSGFVDYELDDGTTNAFDKRYEAFAKLVEEKEREACAKMCDYVYDNIVTDEHIKAMAFKIRTRGQK